MKIFIYSGTHWDREWYKCFQGFRAMLVKMMDGLLEGLETMPEYGVHHLDGQTILLEDYLDIRPENKDRLAKLIKDGKLIIGPWYCMPDEYLISGESMIKNLQKGMSIARGWGVEPSHNAYICDIFGHSSQTPQIFAGMNLHHTVLGRGTNGEFDPGHFRWQALDGSEVLVYRLRDGDGYGDFGAFMRDLPKNLTDEEFDRHVKAYVDDEIARCQVPVIMLMDAVDHLPFHPEVLKFISAIRRLYPDAEVCQVAIDEMDDEQSKYQKTYQVRVGEICRPAKVHASYVHLITHTLSSRYPLKQYNDRNQTLLEKWVSPLYAFGMTEMADGFLTKANEYLLKNHPHDSICGCSIDQVHRDMMYRFDQTRLICNEVLNPFYASLAGCAVCEEKKEDGLCLRVYNPLPYRMKRTVLATVNLTDMTTYEEPFWTEKVPSFKLFDANGNQVEYGITRALGKGMYQIRFATELVPMGVTEMYLAPSNYPTRNPNRLLKAVNVAEGDFLRLTVNDNGTVDLMDKQTGEEYKGLLNLIDDGEIGDGWYHCSPHTDTLVSPKQAEVKIIENTAVCTTFRITQKMELPIGVENHGGIRRSDEVCQYRVTHDVSLCKSDRGINVHTSIDNNARDHRLRLHLPTAVLGSTYEAAQAFGYVTRTCGDDKSTAEWKEYGCVEKNMANLCAKRDGNRGIAFISACGLHECGVWENGDIDVTLMRCTTKTVHTDGEPDGQLIGLLEYDYRIQPYTASDRFADLEKEKDFLASGVACASVWGKRAEMCRPVIELEGRDIVYSTANKLDRDYSEIRVFNDGGDEQTASILLPVGTTDASLTEIDGREIQRLAIENETVRFTLGAFRIATVRFKRNSK